MTFRQLLETLKRFTDEELDLDVSVYTEHEDEYFDGIGIRFCNDGVLDDDDPYICTV